MRKNKQTQFDSNARVYPIRTHGFGVWGNRRIPFTIRVDEKLAKASKPVLKQLFGSTCRGIETYLAGLVATYQQQGIDGVYPNNTVEIGKLVVERNMRSRRKLEVIEEHSVTESVKVVNCSFCGKPSAVAKFQHVPSGIVKDACDVHTGVLRKREDWLEVTST